MIYLVPYSAAITLHGITLITRGSLDFKANPTLAVGDVLISKDGFTYVNMATLPTVVPAGATALQVDISGAEATTEQISIRFIDQTGPKEWEDQVITVQTMGHANSMHPNIGNEITGFALASVCTEARLAELGAANMPADIDTIKSDVTTIKTDTGDISSIKTQTDKIIFTTGDNVQSELAAERFADFPEGVY